MRISPYNPVFLGVDMHQPKILILYQSGQTLGRDLSFSRQWILNNVCVTQADILASALSILDPR